MLNITELNRFYFIRNFHDTRCKYDRVLSIVHEQFRREPERDEVFIIMSRDRRKVRLFNYDRRSESLFEKRFSSGYRFMKVTWEGTQPYYSINWKDVLLILNNPVVNILKIK